MTDLNKWKVDSTSDKKSLKTVCEDIDNARKGLSGIKLDPEYQREYKFTEKDESLLIESILMGIPIPIIYLSSDTNQIPHVSNVIDGQHRLRAVYRFINDKFQLKGLEKYGFLNGFRFSDLPSNYQNKLLYQSNLSFENIHVQDNPEIEMEIFKRYNMGTHPLSKQEIRHAVYRSKFNLWLNMKVDTYFGDRILKDMYNINKKRYADKSAHETCYLILAILKHGLNTEFNTSPEYADYLMDYASNYSDQDSLIAEYEVYLSSFTKFLLLIHDKFNIDYPLSKEIYGIESRNYKVQTPIVMLVAAFMNYLINNNYDFLDNDLYNAYFAIKNTLKSSYLEDSTFKGSNTRPSELINTLKHMITIFELSQK